MNKKMRVYWIPQVPMQPFYVDVKSVEEGVKVMNLLANYDLFQYENKVKGDYANAGGLQVFDEEEGDWEDWTLEFDIDHKGVNYFGYYDEPQYFLDYLNDLEISEELFYSTILEVDKNEQEKRRDVTS